MTNSATCSSEQYITATVFPNPIATFSYPKIICEKQTAVTLVNTSSVPTGVSSINKYWWSIEGTIEQSSNPTVFTPDHPGLLPVKLVVTTDQGCVSDTNNTALQIHYRPQPMLKYSAPLCSNETISFTDLSSMPHGATGENVEKWSWDFDNGTRSSEQNPATNFTAGVHHATFITETNYGCKSIAADSVFTINEKPVIQLEINDSCVFRTIKYRAIDVLNTVEKWYWNFGSGFYKGNAQVLKSYNKEGYRPLTLMAETIKGCKDTVVRAFTIYDNKAAAGRDTIAAMDEPVQLDANGGANVNYVWTPSLGLNNPALEKPLATLDRDQLYRLDATTDKGCDSHSTIMIKRFKGPDLYIPTAFTPNGDGLNEVLRVFPVGIKSFNYFAVYNRFGQKIYYTTNFHEGWNGTLNGVKLDAGTFAVYASAIDYRGNLLERKNTVTLIR